MIKKIVAVLILLSTVCFLLVGCGTEGTAQDVTYTFAVGSTTVAIDAPAASLLEALGAWSDYAESPSCAFEGMDKVYTYASFELETYCLGGVDYIAAVHLLDDSVTTRKGIRIGSTAQEVLDAYGTPASQSDAAIVYTATGMKLQFLLRDGVVTNIQYLKNS
ncbi:MAG: hypothetical protein IJX28_03425 [Clostridia bacterium]|nr:hypothetical protein [Clostridia bacterium]